MDTEDNASASASGPSVSVDGIVFLRKRTCNCCGISNTAYNEITGTSAMSASNHKFTVWGRGTSVDPVGKHCRICVLTHQHGGFSEDAAGPTLDAFCDKMKKTQSCSRSSAVQELKCCGFCVKESCAFAAPLPRRAK